MDYKFISWNIDSLNAALSGSSERSALSLAVVASIADEDPDLVAIQETKLSDDPKKVAALFGILTDRFPGYEIVHRISVPPARKGYSGTLVLYKKALDHPIVSYPEIGAPSTMDAEGRVITLELPDFFVTTVYTPNAGDGLARLADRGSWDDCYRTYLHGLDARKPVFACGDFNVAHTEIDLARPDSNHESAGFTDQEREKFTQLLDAGFVDTFRALHPDATGVCADGRSSYTWFSQRVRTSKANNTGWRIDYWLASARLSSRVTRCETIDTGERRDHLPVVMEFSL